MQKKELTLGKWNNASLAEWFGCAEKTFRNKKRDYLSKLEHYAVFHEEKGKVIIEEVKKAVFEFDNTTSRKSNRTIVRQEVNKPLYDRLKDNFGGVIMSDMAKDIQNRRGQELIKKDGTPISFKTIRQYVYESVREQLGTPGKPGPKGSRELIILICRDNKWDLPTKEELSRRSEIINKYYSKKESAEILHNLLQAKKEQELSVEDVGDMLMAAIDKGSKFELCQQEIEEAVGTFKQKTILHWLDSNEETSPEVAERIVKFFEKRGKERIYLYPLFYYIINF